MMHQEASRQPESASELIDQMLTGQRGEKLSCAKFAYKPGGNLIKGTIKVTEDSEPHPSSGCQTMIVIEQELKFPRRYPIDVTIYARFGAERRFIDARGEADEQAVGTRRISKDEEWVKASLQEVLSNGQRLS